MAFKNLEQRFNENVNKLYRDAKTKFEKGKPSRGRNDAPLIVRKPGEGYWNFAESRSTPIASTANDLKRLTLFQLSVDGIKFLAKQQLLQTGNTFKFTRVINPAFVVANAVPFLHIKRNLRPVSELKGKTDTSYENVRKMGTMQSESYDRLKKWKQPLYLSQHFNSSPDNSKNNAPSLLNRLGGFVKSVLAKTSVGEKLKQAFSPISSTLSIFNVNLKRNVGEEKKWSESRPELAKNSIVDQVDLANVLYQERLLADAALPTDTTKDIKYIRYFSPASGINRSQPGDDFVFRTTALRKDNPGGIKNAVLPEKTIRKISYIKDPLNAESPSDAKTELKPYKKLLSPVAASLRAKPAVSDIIRVSFAMGNNEHVQFRAFVKDLQQVATPEYKPYQYIGRIEKFINYLGVQREISFKLGIIAFSRDELDIVWTRINYITSFVYPYGFHKGIMQPNIVRLTIGELYVDQPGYVTSLNTNFNGITDSWEIDKGKQVPISAEMDIKFTLIEKYTKIASSPFYGITEQMENKEKRKIFEQPIQIPKTTQESKNARTDAPSNQTPEKVDVEKQTPNPKFSNTEENLARGTGGVG